MFVFLRGKEMGSESKEPSRVAFRVISLPFTYSHSLSLSRSRALSLALSHSPFLSLDSLVLTHIHTLS